jgi:hypothetical protein
MGLPAHRRVRAVVVEVVVSAREGFFPETFYVSALAIRRGRFAGLCRVNLN